MKASIAHLPDHKQQELQRAVEIIREEIDLELLILFGSYARGDWVEDLDPETLQYRYQSDFDYWFNQAKICLVGFNDALSHGFLNKAAFELHQTTEGLYGAILLVFTRYKPSTHDFTKLAKRVASVEPQFLAVFPQGAEEESARFKLLRKAYVDARYKPSYSIIKEQLTWLAERVEHLQLLTEKLCKEKIASFE
ncbi:HEPN domain-containing protein [Thalassomonas haliotis]|uniref:HEPN domain-containing protein n=1 Tax=Thalassomonas haliotis TaxID=485448 RepID=A0ABY7VJK3_9GAMM|nr:HEPN domain-containing protein [Thalassomonas haliotis]WDE13653.1 HEPN domain-containing protein [Thalassomonas haliotis]